MSYLVVSLEELAICVKVACNGIVGCESLYAPTPAKAVFVTSSSATTAPAASSAIVREC